MSKSQQNNYGKGGKESSFTEVQRAAGFFPRFICLLVNHINTHIVRPSNKSQGKKLFTVDKFSLTTGYIKLQEMMLVATS